MCRHKKEIVIGLHGGIGAGKSIGARFLIDTFDFKCVSFADPIKSGCRQLFGFNDYQLYDRIGKETIDSRYGISPRDAFRFVGGSFREHICTDIWVKRMQHTISQCGVLSIVIDDVRHQNEVDFIEDFDEGYVISMTRPDNPYNIHMSDHPSDTSELTIKSGIHICNDSSIDALKVKLLFVLNDIGYLDRDYFQKTIDIINSRYEV